MDVYPGIKKLAIDCSAVGVTFGVITFCVMDTPHDQLTMATIIPLDTKFWLVEPDTVVPIGANEFPSSSYINHPAISAVEGDCVTINR